MSKDESLKELVPAGHVYMRENILGSGNIFGLNETRSAWAVDLNLPRSAQYFLFAGCGYQFARYGLGLMGVVENTKKIGLNLDRTIGVVDAFKRAGISLTDIVGKITTIGKGDPYTRVLIASVNVLRKLGFDLGYLYEKEPCCGSPFYYSGFVDDYVKNAQRTYEVFKSMGVKRIIGLPSPCTSSLRTLYPKFLDTYDLEVEHFIEVVAERLSETDMRPRLKERLTVTYHDPCHLSRYLNIIDEPREVMLRIDGLELREPKEDQRGKWSTCCGGGGLEVTASELCERIAERRVTELLATGARIIATNCPGCMMQLIKGVKKLKVDAKVVDIAEILDEAL